MDTLTPLALTPMTEPVGRRGTARDVLRQPDFVRVWGATFLSNTGRWMQSAAQGVLAWELTESPAFLGFMVFAGLVPLSLLSLVGGSLADTFDRRKLIISSQVWQLVWSAVLAVLVIDDYIAPPLFALIAFITSVGQGIYAPVFTSVLPSLAGPGNIGAAISLNSTQTNASRIIGPAIGGWLTSKVGFAEVFAINSLTYLIVIAAIAVTTLPPVDASVRSLGDRLLGGFRIAFRAPQVGLPLLTMALFTFFCLPFIGQMPAIAEINLAVDATSSTYGLVYAVFGAGAFFGALGVGTVLSQWPRTRTLRLSMLLFAVSLSWLALASSVTRAAAAFFFVGLFYFMVPTTLATMWQEHVKDEVRGRVSALWVLAFGGTIPFANLVAGKAVEATSLRTVLLVGAGVAVALAGTARFVPGPPVGEEIAGKDP